jgi:hypothetical protein
VVSGRRLSPALAGDLMGALVDYYDASAPNGSLAGKIFLLGSDRPPGRAAGQPGGRDHDAAGPGQAHPPWPGGERRCGAGQISRKRPKVTIPMTR